MHRGERTHLPTKSFVDDGIVTRPAERLLDESEQNSDNYRRLDSLSEDDEKHYRFSSISTVPKIYWK